MTIETSIDTLTLRTTELLDVSVSLRDSTTQMIASAVILSENAALVPLIQMATNLIDMQSLLVTYISRG